MGGISGFVSESNSWFHWSFVCACFMHAMMGKSRRSTRDDGRTNLAFELEPNSSSLNSTVIQSSSDLRPQPFHRLFRFASTIDKFMLAIGLTFALLTAACLPIIIIIFGKLINTVIDGGFEPDSNSLLCNATLNVSSPHKWVLISFDKWSHGYITQQIRKLWTWVKKLPILLFFMCLKSFKIVV